MTEAQITDFTESIVGYFQKNTGTSPRVGVPTTLGTELRLLDYSGLIGISGKHQGCLCFTAGAEMLRQLGEIFLPGQTVEERLLRDLAGEIANTLAGNAQLIFGEGFHISVPIMLGGRPEELVLQNLKDPVYQIPLFWNDTKGVLILGVDA